MLTQGIEDFEAAKTKAMKIGAESCHVVDLRREFIEELCVCFPGRNTWRILYGRNRS